MYKNLLILLTLCALLITSCKDEVDPEDISYKCECGSVSWNGSSYLLTDAHWVTTGTEIDEIGLEIITAKDYYTTAKVELEGEIEPHHLNMKLSIPDISEGVMMNLGGTRFYDIDSTNVTFNLEEVNFNSLSTVDDFLVVAGAFELTQGLGSEIDDISFTLEIVRAVDGSPAGFPFLYSGSLTAAKEEF